MKNPYNIKEEQLIFEENKVKINNNYIQEEAARLAASIENNLNFNIVKKLETNTLIKLKHIINKELEIRR